MKDILFIIKDMLRIMKEASLLVIIPMWNLYLGWLQKNNPSKYEQLKEWEAGVKEHRKFGKATIEFLKIDANTKDVPVDPRGCHEKVKEVSPKAVATYEMGINAGDVIKILQAGIATEKGKIEDADVNGSYILLYMLSPLGLPLYVSVQATQCGEQKSSISVALLSKRPLGKVYVAKRGINIERTMDSVCTAIRRVLALGDNAAEAAKTAALVQTQQKQTQQLKAMNSNMGCLLMIIIIPILLWLLAIIMNS